MGITNNDAEKASRIAESIDEYFKNPNETTIQAKELMDIFIKKDNFRSNHRDGLPIRKFLRHLERENHLHLIPQAYFEQKAENKNWYFIKS